MYIKNLINLLESDIDMQDEVLDILRKNLHYWPSVKFDVQERSVRKTTGAQETRYIIKVNIKGFPSDTGLRDPALKKKLKGAPSHSRMNIFNKHFGASF